MSNIRIEQAKGVNLATRQEVLFSHYNVIFENTKVAIVGWESDSKVLFLVNNLSPLAKEEVLEVVANKLSIPDPESAEPADLTKQLEEFEASLDNDDDEEFVNVAN